MLNRLSTFAASALLLATFSAAAHAESMDAPNGEIVLTISGDIETTNVGDTLQLDQKMFVALGLEAIETTTIWTEGTQTFEGVSLATLTELLGVMEGKFLASAINDYTIEIPVTDAVEGGPFIAIRLNGEFMSIRDKGPLWVIYPYDRSADYRSEVIYSRSIWQLDRIEVVK